jgi:hypothetical protein
VRHFFSCFINHLSIATNFGIWRGFGLWARWGREISEKTQSPPPKGQGVF